MIDLLPIRQDCKSASLLLRLMKRTKITELPDFAMLDDTFEVPLEINELTGVGTFPMPPIDKYVPIVMQAKVVDRTDMFRTDRSNGSISPRLSSNADWRC